MSLSNSRDVQDLIAEFVSSKNQTLHEEIISSIKRESFAHLEDQKEEVNQEVKAEVKPDSIPHDSIPTAELDEQIPAEYLEEIIDIPAVNQEELNDSLEGKIAELMHQNSLLQEELAKANGQGAMSTSGNKSMSSDDLRMEFLNFTSAHIQQFNHRIKKTEELIETLSQKSQSPNEKKSKRDFPVWLQWANIIALALIAIYFLLNFFAGSKNDFGVAKQKIEVKKPEAIAAPVSKPVEAQAIVKTDQAVEEEKLPPQNTVLTEPVSTPFQTANVPTANIASANVATTNAATTNSKSVEKSNQVLTKAPAALVTPNAPMKAAVEPNANASSNVPFTRNQKIINPANQNLANNASTGPASKPAASPQSLPQNKVASTSVPTKVETGKSIFVAAKPAIVTPTASQIKTNNTATQQVVVNKPIVTSSKPNILKPALPPSKVVSAPLAQTAVANKPIFATAKSALVNQPQTINKVASTPTPQAVNKPIALDKSKAANQAISKQAIARNNTPQKNTNVMLSKSPATTLNKNIAKADKQIVKEDKAPAPTRPALSNNNQQVITKTVPPTTPIAKSVSQPAGSSVNTKPQTEKKQENKVKVYFGED